MRIHLIIGLSPPPPPPYSDTLAKSLYRIRIEWEGRREEVLSVNLAHLSLSPSLSLSPLRERGGGEKMGLNIVRALER